MLDTKFLCRIVRIQHLVRLPKIIYYGDTQTHTDC